MIFKIHILFPSYAPIPPNDNEHSWCQTTVSNIIIHQTLPSGGREMDKLSLQLLIVPKSKKTSKSHVKGYRSYTERAPTGLL